MAPSWLQKTGRSSADLFAAPLLADLATNAAETVWYGAPRLTGAQQVVAALGGSDLAVNAAGVYEGLLSGVSARAELGVGGIATNSVNPGATFVSATADVEAGAAEVSPSVIARTAQGSKTYPGIDTYTDTILAPGTKVVGAVPGQSPFYTTLDAFNSTGGDAAQYYEGLQISPNLTNPAYPPYRPGVTVYEVTDSLPAATGNALANPQFGAGGLPQFYIPNYPQLKPLYSIPFRAPGS